MFNVENYVQLQINKKKIINSSLIAKIQKMYEVYFGIALLDLLTLNCTPLSK